MHPATSYPDSCYLMTWPDLAILLVISGVKRILVLEVIATSCVPNIVLFLNLINLDLKRKFLGNILEESDLTC